MPLVRPDPGSRYGAFILRLAGTLARWIVRSIARTTRFEVVEGAARLEHVLGEPGPMLLVMWHDRAILSAGYFSEPHIRRRLDVALMISQSRDGEFVAQIVRPWKRVRSARGSASRGGRQALRVLYRLVDKEQIPCLLAPDGPRGPIRHFKAGVAVLAQMTGAVVQPVALAPSRCWRLGSWDRVIVPKPFGRVAVAFGEPMSVERGLSPEELEATRARLEEELEQTTRRAERAVAREPW